MQFYFKIQANNTSQAILFYMQFYFKIQVNNSNHAILF